MRSVLSFFALAIVCLTTAAVAATWTVDNPGDGEVTTCPAPVPAGSMTFRQAVFCANEATGSDDKIVAIPNNLGPGGTLTEIKYDSNEQSVRINSGPLDTGTGKYIVRGLPSAEQGNARPIIRHQAGAFTPVINSQRAVDDLLIEHLEISGGSGPYGAGFLHDQITGPDRLVTIDDCVFRQNHSTINGGAISSFAPLLVKRSQFVDNVTNDSPIQTNVGQGGAIYVENYNTARIESSEFIRNRAGYRGGAIYTAAINSTIVGCTFEDNFTIFDAFGSGGGAVAYNLDTGNFATIANSTFVGNQASYDNITNPGNPLLGSNGLGGGVFLTGRGQVDVRHSTIVDGRAAEGGGVAAINSSIDGRLNLSNTIVARNRQHSGTANDCYCNLPGGSPPSDPNMCDPDNHLVDGRITRAGMLHLEVMDLSVSPTPPPCTISGFAANEVTAATGLATALADNGGPVRTLALASGATAIDAADTTECDQLANHCLDGASVPCALVDARGQARPGIGGASAAACDVGAFEATTDANVIVTKTADVGTVFVGDEITYTITLTNGGPDTAYNVSMSDTLPVGVSFVSVNPSTQCTFATGTVTCLFASLAANAATAVIVVVTADITGDITNTAIIDSNTPDSSPNDNSSGVTVTSSNRPAEPSGPSAPPGEGEGNTPTPSNGNSGAVSGVGIGSLRGGAMSCSSNAPDIAALALTLFGIRLAGRLGSRRRPR